MTNTLIPSADVPKLNIQALDAEHATIVKYVNELHAGMLAGAGREVQEEVLGRLISETQAHFTTEEGMMREHDYPDFVSHKSDHDRLIAHVVDLERQFREGELLLSFAIMLDIKNWATIHIDRSDRPLGKFLKSKGVR